MARVYAIASAKGGVGKTTTTANLGATLAGTGAEVVVIDGDIGMANLGAALGVRPHGATLHDVLSGEVEPAAAAYEGPAGLTVVPGDTSLEAFAAAEPQQLSAVVAAFGDADYVLIDVGAGISHETSVPLSLADAVVLVSTPERDALVDTEKTRQLTERLGGLVAGAVITRTDEATPIEEVISGTLTAEVLATVPEDEAVRESIAVGEPLVSYAPHSDAATAYRRLAAELTGVGIDPTPSTEPSTADHEAETRSALEARDQQLSESLSETGITIDPGDGTAVEAGETTADETPTTVDEAGETTADGTSTTVDKAGETTADGTPTTVDSESDNEHNVVNPFAATPKDELETDDLDEDESKWAEAATGSAGDLDADSEDIQITADTDDDSVPPDAIPFGSTADKSADDEPTDEESAQTTVLGSTLEESESGQTDTEADTDADPDEPLIPDAEETAAANAAPPADDELDDPDDVDSDADEDDETEEKRGFFSRLFG